MITFFLKILYLGVIQKAKDKQALSDLMDANTKLKTEVDLLSGIKAQVKKKKKKKIIM